MNPKDWVIHQKGANALSHAAYRNHLDVVVMLAEKGVDANEVDSVSLDLID